MDIKRKYNFSLKPYGKKKEYFLIRLRVSYPGNRVDFSTGCNVLTEEAWNPDTQRIRKGYIIYYLNECHSYDLVVFIGFILIEVDKF